MSRTATKPIGSTVCHWGGWSRELPARANRITHLIVASIQVPFAAFTAVGEVGGPWIYFYVLGVALEMIVLAFILRSSWTWPSRTASPATPSPSLDSEPFRTQQQALGGIGWQP